MPASGRRSACRPPCPMATMVRIASSMAACTSGWPGLPRWPIEAARSAGPMKTPSHAVDRADRLAGWCSAATDLGLHQQADLVVGGIQVVGARAPARGPAHGAAHAADAVRRIARGATTRRACSAVSTIGTSRFCAPMSSSCLMQCTSPLTARTTGCDRYGATACSAASVVRRSFGACSPSTSSQSKPAVALISAMYGSAIDSHRPIWGRLAARCGLECVAGHHCSPALAQVLEVHVVVQAVPEPSRP